MLDKYKPIKKFILAIWLFAAIFIATVSASCAYENSFTCAYPNIVEPYTINFVNNGVAVQGEINYTNSNNYTVTYLSPKSIKGFSASIRGDKCRLSFKDMAVNNNIIPFAQDSPVDIVVKAFECCENGSVQLLWSKSAQCCFTAVNASKEYKILCDARTGNIQCIIFRDKKIDLSTEKEPAA